MVSELPHIPTRGLSLMTLSSMESTRSDSRRWVLFQLFGSDESLQTYSCRACGCWNCRLNFNLMVRPGSPFSSRSLSVTSGCNATRSSECPSLHAAQLLSHSISNKEVCLPIRLLLKLPRCTLDLSARAATHELALASSGSKRSSTAVASKLLLLLFLQQHSLDHRPKPFSSSLAF